MENYCNVLLRSMFMHIDLYYFIVLIRGRGDSGLVCHPLAVHSFPHSNCILLNKTHYIILYTKQE